MKLIIDIDDEQVLFDIKNRGLESETETDKVIINALYNGTPLEDVKAEIAEEICLTNNPYTEETKYTIEHLRLIDILDNIGKAESEK